MYAASELCKLAEYQRLTRRRIIDSCFLYKDNLKFIHLIAQNYWPTTNRGSSLSRQDFHFPLASDHRSKWRCPHEVLLCAFLIVKPDPLKGSGPYSLNRQLEPTNNLTPCKAHMYVLVTGDKFGKFSLTYESKTSPGVAEVNTSHLIKVLAPWLSHRPTKTHPRRLRSSKPGTSRSRSLLLVSQQEFPQGSGSHCLTSPPEHANHTNTEKQVSWIHSLECYHIAVVENSTLTP